MRRIIVGAYPTFALLIGLTECGLGLLTPTFPAIGGAFVLSQLALLILFAVTTMKVFHWMDREASGPSDKQSREGERICGR